MIHILYFINSSDFLPLSPLKGSRWKSAFRQLQIGGNADYDK